jgi:hypothetical protein
VSHFAVTLGTMSCNENCVTESQSGEKLTVNVRNGTVGFTVEECCMQMLHQARNKSVND